MTCPDLCTAAKCEELENRISALEQTIELLVASFEAHVSQDIPEAHNYVPEIPEPPDLSGYCTVAECGEIYQGLQLLEASFEAHVSQDIPEAHNYVPEIPEPPDLSGYCTVAECGEIYQGLQLLEASFEAHVSQDIPEAHNYINPHVKSQLQLGSSFQNNILTIQIQDGESGDVTQVYIDADIINNYGGNNVTCPELSQDFQKCCSQILSLINSSFSNLDNQLANIENALNGEIKSVYDQVTVDISGTANSNYDCKFPTDEITLKAIPAYAQSSLVEKTYQGQGLKGLHENLKIINANLDKIYSESCRAIDPISTITLDDLYQYCDRNANVDRSLYFNEDGSKKYISARDDYDAAVTTALTNLLVNSKFSYLLDNAVGNNLIAAPNNWIAPILANFSLIQSKINNDEICSSNTDVVSLVASPKYITNIEGKVLVLHFVTLPNYPKRTKRSQIRQIQIPGAKENYNWENDFANCRWITGNQYAELELAGYKARVSGWFAGEAQANAFFDYVLINLTTATEANRNIPKHKYKRTDIVSAIERPYRAFIESVNDKGQAVCHVKYMPPKNEPANS